MAKRNKVDNRLFLKLCREGKSNEEIAKHMGWKSPAKSKDPFHRVRAQKSIARTKGLMIAGNLEFLKEAKKKAKSQTKAKKAKAKSKPALKTTNAKSLLETNHPEPQTEPTA